MSKRPVRERFFRYVREMESGCWEWNGCILRSGYGQFSITPSEKWRAHRLAWTLSVGPVPPGMFVLHTCDNRKCVNPNHLFLGNHEDNMNDKVSKGRQARGAAVNARKGQFSGKAKLLDSEVEEIRRARASGEKVCSIALRYGVAACSVSQICNYKFRKLSNANQ